MQEESSIVTFDSHVIKGKGNSDRSLSDIKTVMKGEFCVGESLTHTISDYGGLFRPFASTETVSVSYTHLDVYKRQTYRCSTRSVQTI